MQTCRRELVDRTLIGNRPHLLHALRELAKFRHENRHYQGAVNIRPLHPFPAPLIDSGQVARLDARRLDRLGGPLHEYEHAA